MSQNRHPLILYANSMTGAPPVPDRPALRAALSHMRIELPGPSPRFEEALAEEQGWIIGFAERVTDEYRASSTSPPPPASR